MIVQSVSLAAACAVLYAFYMHQRGMWQATEARYLGCNFVGTAILTVVAWIGSRWSFVLVEGIWVLANLCGLLPAVVR